MHGTPLATSSPIRSKIKQMGRRKAKNSRRSVSLLDVSAIHANPDVSSQISESNETLASGYRDSGYVKSEASSLEEDDSKGSKDLVEELKFKDVLICELQESNRGLRLRCADAENKIWRLRVKCQSHCACCQVTEMPQSPTDSANDDKDEAPSTKCSKRDLLSQDLFQFKRTNSFSTSSNDVNLLYGHDRLTNSRDRLANSFSVRGNVCLPDSSTKLLTRSKSSGTIGTQTPASCSSRRTQAAEKLFALKVQQWQKEHLLKSSSTDGSSVDQLKFSSSNSAELSTKKTHPLSTSAHTSLPLRTLKVGGHSSNFEVANGESPLLSGINERDSLLEVESGEALNPDLFSSPSSPDGLLTNSLLPQSTPFADITNQRTTSAYAEKSQVQKAFECQRNSIPNLGFEGDGHTNTLKDQRAASGWTNSMFSESVSGPHKEGCKSFPTNANQFLPHESSCGHCKCAQPSPVIIVPAGCCSCCKMTNSPLDTRRSNVHHHFEGSPEIPKTQNSSQLKLDVSTDSSDLHPIFEMKSKSSFTSGKSNFSATPEFDSEHQAPCRSTSSYRDCKCSLTCSSLTVPLASRCDANAKYILKIEESMRKIASDARAENESLSFQPWTDCSEMSPQMKVLAEASHYVNKMAIILNRATNRFHQVTGTPKPVNPFP